MKKRIIFGLIVIFLVVFCFGCEKKEIEEETAACPKTCDDSNNCTEDFCSSETNYTCVHQDIVPCCGNEKCEFGEDYTSCEKDCVDCNDNNNCTTDSFDYDKQECVYTEIKPCCGNGKCELGESYETCREDCEQAGEYDFSEYLQIFDKSFYIIVGREAPAIDVATATDILMGLNKKGRTGEVKLHDEVSKSSLENDDMIIIGCENEITKDLLGINDCDDFLSNCRAVIKYIINENNEIVVVAGHNPADTRKVVDIVVNPFSNNAFGYEIMINTCATPAEVLS